MALWSSACSNHARRAGLPWPPSGFGWESRQWEPILGAVLWGCSLALMYEFDSTRLGMDTKTVAPN